MLLGIDGLLARTNAAYPKAARSIYNFFLRADFLLNAPSFARRVLLNESKDAVRRDWVTAARHSAALPGVAEAAVEQPEAELPDR